MNIPFLITELRYQSLGDLCDALSQANIAIYYYENKKWWGRKHKKATSSEIDFWDEQSRIWNEQRSKIKNKLDDLFAKSFTDKKSKTVCGFIKDKKDCGISFQVLPISLLIDMLTIENIKIYDLTFKKYYPKRKNAEARKKEILRVINQYFEEIIQTGNYKLKSEVRTF